MCGTCVTQVEAIGVQSIGLVAVTLSVARRVVLGRRGISGLARRASDWDESAAFLSRLGHDPADLLGPRPVEEAPVTGPPPPARHPVLV